ncbi:MAG: MoxR family ATPase [Rhodospirillales bacterium]|nr:MoxR family ATPase [Rhodospirillales bacterium]
MSARDSILELKRNVQQDIIGQSEIVDRLIIGLLANGNLLVEGLPGLAKTRAIKSLASNMDCDYRRIQFTPDLVSTDITGRSTYYKGEDGEAGLTKFEKGPIFANIVLADEINRAPSKVQNSLLEAMEERQVTVSGTAYKMPDLFLVMATQNPVEQEGTFALPEAQMDRFLMHVTVDYPDEESEAKIIRLVREEEAEKRGSGKSEKTKTAPLQQKVIFDARNEVDQIKVPEAVEKYIVDIIFATRYPDKYGYTLKSYLKVGASPRGSLALDRCARARAWLDGRDTVTAEDIQAMAKPVLRHRLGRGERAYDHKVTTDEIVDHILELIPAP